MDWTTGVHLLIGTQIFFLFVTMFQLDIGLTPIQWASGTLFLRVGCLEHKTDHSHLSNPWLRMQGALTSTLFGLHRATLPLPLSSSKMEALIC
jgi:hypothetical protein